jgi:hypothetical protein
MTVIRFPNVRDRKPATEQVSEEVRALIGRHDINQTVVARWLGITQSAVSARLRGDTEWKVSEIDILASRFGVHPAELLGGYAEDPRPNGGPGIRAGAEKLPRLDSNQEPTD